MNTSFRFRVLVLLLALSQCAAQIDAKPTKTPTATPTPAASPKPTPRDELLELPPLDIGTLPRLPDPNLTATPNVSTSINSAPTALPPATVARLNALLSSSEMSDAHVGVCIQALGTTPTAGDFPSKAFANDARPILFSSDGDKRFLPASNMKLFTAALSLKVLGAEKTFATRVYATSSTRNDAVTLLIVGGGDPSLTIDDLRDLARQAKQNGIVKVEKIVADTSLFQAETLGGRYPDGWTLDDALWYYGAEVSSLALERNQVDITITGAKKGQPAKVSVDPILPGFSLDKEIIAQVKTGGRELKDLSESDLIQFERSDDQSALGTKLFVRGQVAPGQTISDGLAVPNVARVVALTFAQQLRAQGVSVEDKNESGVLPTKNVKLVATHDSAPLRVLLQRFLKKSDNLYGEMLLRDVGATVEKTAGKSGNTSDESSGVGISSTGTAARAHGLLLRWLKSENVPTAGLRLSDGSGLSRYNLVTPRAIVSLLAATERLDGSRAFWDALPIAGTDGTLKKRMVNTRAADNARAKTGTFSIASCLSGYVTTRDGTRLAVSILTNFARDGDQSRQMQNDIFSALADASLR